MSRPPVFRPAAARDLEAIWTYTADHWGLDQADRYVTAIHEACFAVARGEREGADASDIRPGYFKIRSGRHLAFYRRDPAGNIDVVRILYERMDTRARLTGPEQA